MAQQALSAVRLSAVRIRRVLEESEERIREVGRALFTALPGTGEVASRYQASAAMAAGQGQLLRMVARIDDPVLAALPWEAMYDDLAGGYVCRRGELVRHVPIAAPVPRLAVDLPLADPGDSLLSPGTARS
jgi:hypothetical protein